MNFKSKVLIAALGSFLLFGAQPVAAHDGHSHNGHALPVPAAARSGQQMTDAAASFLDSLSDGQRAEIIFPFDSDADRTHWSNAPVDSVARIGLPIGRLSLEQRELLHQLLIASTSSQGYHKVWAAVRGDDELKKEGENRELDSTKFFTKNQSLGAIDYWVAVFGDARTDKDWGFMLTGHHLAANFTVVDGKATFVPMFYGSDPAFIATGAHAGHVFLPQERRRGYELLSSLDERQRAVAVVADTVEFNKFGALEFTGPGKKDWPTEPRGITADKLSEEQLTLLWQLIAEYVGNSDFDVTADHMARIKADGLANISFMWMGPTDGSEQIFYRVYSPSILIDFVDQRTGFDWNTHPHVIVRDPSNDYGEHWLQRHISEAH